MTPSVLLAILALNLGTPAMLPTCVTALITAERFLLLTFSLTHTVTPPSQFLEIQMLLLTPNAQPAPTRKIPTILAMPPMFTFSVNARVAQLVERLLEHLLVLHQQQQFHKLLLLLLRLKRLLLLLQVLQQRKHQQQLRRLHKQHEFHQQHKQRLFPLVLQPASVDVPTSEQFLDKVPTTQNAPLAVLVLKLGILAMLPTCVIARTMAERFLLRMFFPTLIATKQKLFLEIQMLLLMRNALLAATPRTSSILAMQPIFTFFVNARVAQLAEQSLELSLVLRLQLLLRLNLLKQILRKQILQLQRTRHKQLLLQVPTSNLTILRHSQTRSKVSRLGKIPIAPLNSTASKLQTVADDLTLKSLACLTSSTPRRSSVRWLLTRTGR
jgi:hypothetical protein